VPRVDAVTNARQHVCDGIAYYTRHILTSLFAQQVSDGLAEPNRLLLASLIYQLALTTPAI